MSRRSILVVRQFSTSIRRQTLSAPFSTPTPAIFQGPSKYTPPAPGSPSEYDSPVTEHLSGNSRSRSERSQRADRSGRTDRTEGGERGKPDHAYVPFDFALERSKEIRRGTREVKREIRYDVAKGEIDGGEGFVRAERKDWDAESRPLDEWRSGEEGRHPEEGREQEGLNKDWKPRRKRELPADVQLRINDLKQGMDKDNASRIAEAEGQRVRRFITPAPKSTSDSPSEEGSTQQAQTTSQPLVKKVKRTKLPPLPLVDAPPSPSSEKKARDGEEQRPRKPRAPPKLISPEAMLGIRALHAEYPDVMTPVTIAKEFGISPKSVQRILKAKWDMSEEMLIERKAKWWARGEEMKSILGKQR